MFSGIIEALERPVTIEKGKDSLTITLPIPNGWNVKLGESIALDGVCCTIQTLEKDTMSFFLMQETLKRTTVKSLLKDHAINLEQSLTLNTLIGGHLVSGHIDITAEVQEITLGGESKTITFCLDKNFAKYVIYKGSITVNGVSLTVVSVADSSFSVSLIPYTLTHTNLGNLVEHDQVNIEVDLIAKYIEKLSRYK